MGIETESKGEGDLGLLRGGEGEDYSEGSLRGEVEE